MFDLPILMITAKNQDKDLVVSFEFGANDYIVKPFNKYELLSRTKTLISLKHAVKKAITNIQQNEREKLAAFEVLLSGLAHNLKTPLMSSTGGIKIIKKDIDKVNEYIKSNFNIGDENITRFIDEINDWHQRTQDNLMYMSKLITSVKFGIGNTDEEEENYFTIKELIEKSSSLITFELKRKKCVLNKEINIDYMEKIKGNINYLIQVLNNILSNAIEASSEGGEIVLGIKKENNCIFLYVENFNNEIPVEVRKKIFKKMVTTKGKHGTGIGLYISLTIIKAKFNGEMFFESNEKETIFYVKIPVQRE
jgi:signal transduction histidine kinase